MVRQRWTELTRRQSQAVKLVRRYWPFFGGRDGCRRVLRTSVGRCGCGLRQAEHERSQVCSCSSGCVPSMRSPRGRSLATARDFVEMFALADSGMNSESCFAEGEKLLQRRNLA